MSGERDLLVEYKDAKAKRDELKEQLTEAQKSFEIAESKLVESLQERDAEATAKYEGIGYASLMKPRIYASFDKEAEEEMFKFIDSRGEAEIVKASVHPSSLNGFVERCLSDGVELPPYLKYYLKTSIRFNQAK